MWYSFFWKFIEDSFKNVYVKLEPLLFARAIYTNVQIKEKSTPSELEIKKKKNIYIYIYIYIYKKTSDAHLLSSFGWLLIFSLISPVLIIRKVRNRFSIM